MGGMLGLKLNTTYLKNYKHTTLIILKLKRFGRIDKNPIYNNTSIDVRETTWVVFQTF